MFMFKNMGMDLEVTSGAIATLLKEAVKSAPAECCGLLLGHGVRLEMVRPAANVAADPTRHFEIDPATLFAAHRESRNGGPELLGYYHSHPNGHPLPSATDCEHASGDNRCWAIIAQGEVRFFRDGADGFSSIAVRHMP
jgi:desampylase